MRSKERESQEKSVLGTSARVEAEKPVVKCTY